MLMQQFRLSEALKTLYSLVWDDFCSWYLEWVKPGFEQPVDQRLYEDTVTYFEELMHLLHPFMPFITEEILPPAEEQQADLCVSTGKPAGEPAQEELRQGELLQKLISSLRMPVIKTR
jgi:valyl-tRNA synthetase